MRFASRLCTYDASGRTTKVTLPDGNVTTTYTYDILNHLTGVSMPRGSNTQTRSFNYTSGTTVGGLLLSATNPETGTVTYSYDSSYRLVSKTDAKSQNFNYQYDSYNRLAWVTWANAPGGAQMLRSYMYDSNTLDTTYSGSYTQGRLVAVQNQSFKPGNSTSPSAIAFTEMYAYTQPGQVSGKRLQVLETISGILHARDLDTAYTYDKEGAMTKVTYPNSGPAYTYSFDSMHRPTGLTDQNNNTDVSGVSYNAASQLLGITYFGANETRQYNSLAQLTQLTVTGSASLSYTYNFPTGTNNGKISSQVVSGETITYQYDSLNRLISAQSSASWGETYGYDAFGNLVAKTPTAGSPPTLSVAANPANNQIVGQTYDANGNQTSAPAGGSLTYDSENRLLTAPGVEYAYDSHNQRVWAGTLDGNGNLTAQTAFVYGLNGQMLGEYSVTAGSHSLTIATTVLTNYFGSKRIGTTNSSGVSTALGSDRLDSVGQYYPYGEGKGGNNPADAWSFATYWRDSATGLDYANHRFFSNQIGRFIRPDPYSGSAHPQSPQSWNRYAYVGNDPINRTDQTGLDACDFSSLNGNAIGDPSAMFAACDQQTGGGIVGGGQTFVTDPSPGNTGAGPTATQSVFQYSLGEVGPGSGNSSLAYSGAYDLNSGAPGFGGNTTPASAVTSAYQQGCQYTAYACTDSDSVKAQNVGGTVNVTMNNNPLDPNAVGNCWLDPLNSIYHPDGASSYYCGGNYFGDTTHVVNIVNGSGVPISTGVHVDAPGPLNPMHWLWSLFGWASDPTQNFTCSVTGGCLPIP